MTAAPFDTLKLARALREASFSTEQAEGAAYAIADAVQTDLATKSDLAEMGLRFQTDLREVSLRFQADLRDTEQRFQAALRETELRLDGKMVLLGGELRTEIAGIKAEIAGTKAEILKCTFGAVGLQTLVILGAVITLLRFVKP